MTDSPVPAVPSSAPQGSVGRASALLASGTIVSRVLGFVSAFVLAATIGTEGSAANTFTVANSLPNSVYAIIAGGLLSAILVPQIVRAASHSDGGEKFINRIVTLGIVAFLAVSILATLCAPFLIDISSQQTVTSRNGFSAADTSLAVAFAYWCLPQIFFYALYSLLGEVLNARKVFGPFTWAPVFNNVVAIIGLVAFDIAFKSRDISHSASWTPGMIALIAGSATLGVVAQAAFLAFFWRRAGLRYRPEFRWRGVGLGKVGKAAGWTFAMILVTQLAGIVQLRVASGAGNHAAGNADLRYAWLIFMLPHGIITVSIATAYFTRMTGHAHRDDLNSLRKDLASSTRSIGLILVFAAIALLVVSYPFAAVFASDHGQDAVHNLAVVLIAYLIGLIPFSLIFMLQRTFYALEDTRTPFFYQTFQSVLLVSGMLIASTLPRDQIAVGIALSTTIANIITLVVAAILLRKRMHRLGLSSPATAYLTFVLAMLPAVVVGLLLDRLLGVFDGGFAVSGRFGAIVSIAVIGGVMAVFYGGVLWLLRSSDLSNFLGPVVRRLKRSR
jgi:putative peptidoglycan lipid II flippase